MGKNQILFILLFTVILITIGCSRAKFTSEEFNFTSAREFSGNENLIDIVTELPYCHEAGVEISECLIIKDSFERDEIFQNDGKPSFGWSKIIDDVLGANGDRVDAAIYDETEMGPTPDAVTGPETDQHRALYFTGRKGGSVHSIYLISREIDLSNFNTLMIGYEYLTVSMEEWNWRGDSGLENIRLEVCMKTKDECGLGATPDEDKLKSDAWANLHQSADFDGDGRNGHDHAVEDYQNGWADIDLTAMDEQQKSAFVFRIAVTIDEGFTKYNGNDPVLSSDLIDGVALDNVIAIASKRVSDPDTPGVVTIPAPGAGEDPI